MKNYSKKTCKTTQQTNENSMTKGKKANVRRCFLGWMAVLVFVCAR